MKIIYADPPWSYRVWRKKEHGRTAESHYSTMTIEEIRTLPVAQLADKNCILFLWVTFPVIREAFTVIDAWGFTYKTVAFCWVKQNRQSSSLFWGMGHWTRANAELCLLATKGSPKRQSAGVHQIVMTPIEGHSKKPDIVRDKIISLAGDVPRIELFARQTTPGWDVWGNEVRQFPEPPILQMTRNWWRWRLTMPPRKRRCKLRSTISKAAIPGMTNTVMTWI